MKITRADLKKLIKEELEANMEEGMFGDMKDKLAGIGSKVLSTMEDVAMARAESTSIQPQNVDISGSVSLVYEIN